MEHIFLPSSIEFHEGDRPNVGKVIITPCHQGYGTTLGNALRRVLLSSLPGAAVESIKIEGVQHEFSAISGVQEDVIEIILNVKQLAVRCFSNDPVTISLRKKGKGPITAADFEKNADIEIMNPDLHIATNTGSGTTFAMDITVGKGRGYVAVSEKETKSLSLGTIAIDSLYTPIRDVGYDVEMTRVGDVTNYEKLTITIETNGTISPREAISQATKILIDHFNLVYTAATEENKVISEEKTEADLTVDALENISAQDGEEEKKPKRTRKAKKSE